MVVFNPLNPLENVTPRFTEEQLSEIVAWFDENSKPLLVINEDPTPTNVITVEQLQAYLGLGKIHRRCFHYPSYKEIMKEVEALNMGAQRMLIKDQFIYILDKWLLEPDQKHELKLAFKVFDTEKRDFLELDLLRDIVTSQGDEPFNLEEYIEFIRDANCNGDGIIYYENFVDSLFAVAPELYELPKEYFYDDPDEDPSVPPLVAEVLPEEQAKPVAEEPPQLPAPAPEAPAAPASEAPLALAPEASSPATEQPPPSEEAATPPPP